MRIVQKKQIGGGVYPSYYYDNLVAIGSGMRKKKESSKESDNSLSKREPTLEEVNARFPRYEGSPMTTRLNGIQRVHAVGDGEGYMNGTEYESFTDLKTGETAEATIIIDPNTGRKTWKFNPGQEEIYNKLGKRYYGRK